MAYFTKTYGSDVKEEPKKEEYDDTKFWLKTLVPGSGKASPAKGDKVKMHYTGTLLDGTVFDSSVKRNQAFSYTHGVGQVIQCWEKGVAQLVKGQKAIFNCPPDIAYGNRATGPIPAKSTLRFEVELLDF